MNFFIENDIAENQFELSLEGCTSFIKYNIDGNDITFIHTEVPFPLKGKGIASALAKYVLEYAKENNLKIIPMCPFIRSYMKRHKEYKTLLKFGFRI